MIYKIAWPLVAMMLLGCAGHPPQRPAHPASARDWAGPVVVPSPRGAIIAGSPASAQEGAEIVVSDKLSLAAALALTVQHNPTLAAFAAEIEARDGAALQSGLLANPSL
ncbi:MAG: hypothetical protein RI601_07325, partial [Desulfurivibrionaceae bacterium]|nr:hypothetical protein [Desulfurivibrionaceae bacterium]